MYYLEGIYLLNKDKSYALNIFVSLNGENSFYYFTKDGNQVSKDYSYIMYKKGNSGNKLVTWFNGLLLNHRLKKVIKKETKKIWK